MSKKIVYVGFAFDHHLNTHGGYHHIAEFADYDYIIDTQSFYERWSHPSKNIFAKIWNKVEGRITGFAAFPDFLLKMVILSYRYNCVFHVIYGEANYTPWMRWLTRKGTKIVCTLHQPFKWYDCKRWRRNIRQMDDIILVGENEIPLFKQVTAKDNVVFIPHGVFCDFYKPNIECKKQKLLLTVGNWLRDYKLADKVYYAFLQKHPDWKIAIVASKESTKVIHKDERIQCMTGISDEQLRNLYQKSTVLFLPLIRYTANNSLLEAAASGCNILIASNSADNSYIPSEYVDIVPLKEEDILNKLEQMMFNDSYNTNLAEYVESKYSWPAIGQKVRDYLLHI